MRLIMVLIAASGEPRQGPLDEPVARDDREALLVLGFVHDVQGAGHGCGGPAEEFGGEGASYP
jgi:hypothetical protein